VRGAGRQHRCSCERLLDIAARSSGSTAPDPAADFIRGRLPTQRDHLQDFTRLSYDGGDYAPMLAKALELVGYERFVRQGSRARAPAARRDRVVCYVGPASGPTRRQGAGADDSKASVLTGIGTQGQGTSSFTQIVADQVGVRAGRR
jgi:CO/xanthine dehydrogenase Mo-binding subunit